MISRQVRRAESEVNCKVRSDSFCTGDLKKKVDEDLWFFFLPLPPSYLDCTTVQVGEFPNERQANTSAFMRTTLNRSHTMESIKYFRQLVRWDACAGVFDRNQRLRVRLAERHSDTALQSKLERITQKIKNDLRDPHCHKKGVILILYLFNHLLIYIDEFPKWRTIDDEI